MRARRLGRGIRQPGLESLFAAALVLFGFRLGVQPIGDNSMLTHLRTGVDMVAGRGIPRSDPYSYTARGHPWVVQSWLPEWTYGWVHDLGGWRLVVLQQALLIAFLAWLVVRLARAGSPLRTALAGVVAVGVGSPYWSPRPLLFGLICMALTVTVVERRRSPWLLLPIVWLWVSSHGSFPLGLLWLAARAGGEALDWRDWPRHALRYLGGFGAGLGVAVLNPLGARLLVFPLTLGDKQEIFRRIVEWQSPNFQGTAGRFALVFIALGLALLLRVRLSWRDVVPAVAFLTVSLVAMRNLPVAAIVWAPVLGRALRRPDAGRAPVVGRAPQHVRLNRALLATLALAFAIFAASVYRRPPLALESYPVEAVTYVERQGLLRPPHRLAHQDAVGNYLLFRYGRRARVFIDDRYDMYPVRVSQDYFTILRAERRALDVLRRRGVDVVVWRGDSALATVLRATGTWAQRYERDGWVVFQRTV